MSNNKENNIAHKFIVNQSLKKNNIFVNKYLLFKKIFIILAL